MAEYSGEFSYINFSMKIRQKIDEWMKTAAPDVGLCHTRGSESNADFLNYRPPPR